MPSIAPIRSAIFVFLLLLHVPVVEAAPPGRVEIFLDRMEKVDWAATRPTVVHIVDSSGQSVWRGCLKQGGRTPSRTNVVDIRQDAGGRRSLPECEVRGSVPRACIDRLADRSRDSELALVVGERFLDSSIQMSLGMGASVPSSYLHYIRSAEVFLVETGSARLLYHARLSGSAVTLEAAEAGLCKEVTERLSNVFDPDLGRNFPRHRVGVNPVGILIAAQGGVFLQGGYERLLGDGRVALSWAPAYLDYVNDEREINYLYLPAIGIRYYLGREGRGWWFGSKLGYARIYDAEYEETSEAHAAFLMAEVGRAWRIKPLYLYAHLNAGAAMGWKEEGWRQYGWYNTPPPDDLESGFGGLPIFEAACGIGYAF